MLKVDVEAKLGTLELRVTLPAAAGTTVLVGPNGAGKSTLLKAILGVVRPRSGEIALDGRRLFSAAAGVNVPTEDRRLGYVPQRYALFSHMTVADNVGFGIRGVSKPRRLDRIMELLEELDIAHLADRKTPSLSGGEAQRVALARALAIRPRALLLDEPMAALDAGARRKVRRFLAERLATIEIPTLVVTHDVADVDVFGGRVAVIDAGRIVQLGVREELEREPATEFVRELFAGEAQDA
jgi:molybdate transport system ATP-binding protein